MIKETYRIPDFNYRQHKTFPYSKLKSQNVYTIADQTDQKPFILGSHMVFG